jgi:hypothetical protein
MTELEQLIAWLDRVGLKYTVGPSIYGGGLTDLEINDYDTPDGMWMVFGHWEELLK